MLKIAGHEGTVKCTNTKQEIGFATDEKPPKLKPVVEEVADTSEEINDQ